MINYKEERKEVFDEAWRALNENFYDPHFHGKNWTALRDKYYDWALNASTETDFRDLVNYMIGEVNSSHMGLYRGDREDVQKEITGLLGVGIKPVDNGVKITKVILNSPADREASKLFVDDVITSVDGKPVTPDINFYSLFINKANERVILEVTGKDGKSREVVIRPSDNINNELYEDWVKYERKLVDKYSNGRLGYIHIEEMGWPSFEVFERELTASGNGKEGLIIDVRYNGGGWTTDYLMTVLEYRQHAYTIPRGATDDLAKNHSKFRSYYPYGERLPFASWTKPSIAMCNSMSYSNAEIFSHAYKTLGIGKLVGEPTFGAVISTGGRRLIDGSFVRLPMRGWYVSATDKSMEWGPAVPDIVVKLSPDAKGKGEDEQLKAAVDELLKEIDSK